MCYTALIMPQSKRIAGRWLLGLLGLLLGYLAQAAPLPFAPVLSGPEVYKLGWNTRALAAADLDGNGFPDLAVLNNEKAKIEILYQYRPGETRRPPKKTAAGQRWQPVFEDTRFWNDGVVTGAQMFALAVGDLNSDGLPELAFTAKPDGLVVLYQQPQGHWERRWTHDQEEPNQWRGSLLIADLNADDRADLLMMAKQALLVFYQTESGDLGAPQRYPLADPDSYGPTLIDADNDGLVDVLYLVPNSHYALRLRLQQTDGRLGAEWVFRYQTPRSELVVQNMERALFATVQAQTGLIHFLELRPGATGGELPSPTPQVYAVPNENSTAGSYALGDVDGDARDDIIVGDHKSAQVWVYRQLEDGVFSEPTSFPSFADVRSLGAADTDGDGRAEVYVASPSERALGVSHMLPTGRLSYPQPLPLEGKPLALTLLDAAGDGTPQLVYLLRQGKERSLVVMDKNQGAWQERQRLTLSGLRADPNGIEAVDVDQDGLSDLMIFVLGDPALLLRRQASGDFRAMSTEDGFRRGLLDNLQPGDLTVGDLDNDGLQDVLVAGKGYARAVKAEADGSLTVVDQFNAANGEISLASAMPLDSDGDGHSELFLVSTSGRRTEHSAPRRCRHLPPLALFPAGTY